MKAWMLAGLCLGALACQPKATPIQVVFTETGGLKPGDNVTMRGLAIGQITDVDLHPNGVVAKLEIKPRYVRHLDQKAVFAIADEKLVTGKRMLTVVPGDPPGAPLEPGATVQGLPPSAGPLAEVKAALDDTVTQAERTLDRTVGKVSERAKNLGRDMLNPDRVAPRAAGGTVDLDQPGRFVLQLLSVTVHPTTADGNDWDGVGAGDPDLLVQAWIDDRQVLLSGKVEDVLTASWDDLRSEPFSLSEASTLRIKVIDDDVGYNDEIGIAELKPKAADVGRQFRLAAGRIAELQVRLERAPEETP
jgi:hypothetical protein